MTPTGTDARGITVPTVKGLLASDKKNFQKATVRSHVTKTTLSYSSQIYPKLSRVNLYDFEVGKSLLTA